MRRLIKKLRKHFLAHKIVGTLVIVLAVWGGYSLFSKLTDTSGDTKYITKRVESGTITETVTSSGQVSASSQVELKSKVSGDVVYLNTVSGQSVPAGALIAQLDARDAVIGLEGARLDLAKLVKPADAVAMLQSENALIDAVQNDKKANDDLVKAYDDGFSTVANAFLDIPDIMTGLDNMLNNYQGGGFLNSFNARLYGEQARIYRDRTVASYIIAKGKYDTGLIHYKNLTRKSATSSLEGLIDETYEMVKSTTDVIKDAKNTADFIRSQQQSGQVSSDGDTAVSSLTTWTNQSNSHLLALLAAKNSIEDGKNAIVSAIQNVREKQEALIKLKEGPDTLDIRSQELLVKQKENVYQDYFIRAPFAGLIAKLDVKKGDSIGSGVSIGTFITHEKLADISLNEVDIAQIKVGQKAVLTFDAVEGLSVMGEVRELDLVGTIDQGVVTYNAKVGFDTDDERIKAGMSTTAAIIINEKQNVLVVPNSAVKTSRGTQAVEVMSEDSKTPQSRTVTIGLSDDSLTEITSGLNVGEIVVTRTILPVTQTTTSAPSLFGGGRTTPR
ncbi:HlyD family efflux transporter periplasmic adaptor subunit [Candidatus Nomurabacteria bacterium]|nr:HlyD family efflux transporter periplasmic adaptor subunit [Candidatus Nomurabacteria bacterium]